jgi:geranylgeranyl reductase family protein
MSGIAEDTLYDAVVVGAGPGGSCAASFLARDGHRVLIVDKARFPRPKPCGDAVSGKSLGVLRELGLQDRLEEHEHVVVESVTFSSPSGHVVNVPFPEHVDAHGRTHTRRYDYVAAGYVVRREVYDTMLFEHARSLEGVDALEEFETTGVVLKDGQACGIRGRDASGSERTVRARTVVGADGAISTVAKSVGAFERDPKHWASAYRSYFRDVAGLSSAIELHYIDDVLPGYFWIFPVDGGLANVGIGVLESEVKKRGFWRRKREINMRRSMYQVIAEHPMFRERFAGATELIDTRRGWLLPMGGKRRVVHGDGWLLIGDAAGLIDPFSGEGIGNAMVSGRLAAEVIHEALARGVDGPSAADLAPYPARLWAELGDELRSSYLLQQLVKHRWLVDLVLYRATKSPRLRRFLSSFLVEYDQKGQFGDLNFYLRLLRA